MDMTKAQATTGVIAKTADATPMNMNESLKNNGSCFEFPVVDSRRGIQKPLQTS